MVFDISTRKYVTEQLVVFGELLFCGIGTGLFGLDRTGTAILATLIHSFIGYFTIVSICLANVHSIWFQGSAILWILVILSNFYFHGCIFAKIERQILQDPNWKGPFGMLFYPFNVSTQTLDLFLVWFVAVPICAVIGWRGRSVFA